MATKYAGATNTNWSAMTWLDGPSGSVTTAPGPADTVELNNKVVRIDTDVTVGTITNALGGYAQTYYQSNNRTINANLVHASGSYGFYFDNSAGSIIVNGNLTETTATGNAFYAGYASPLTINGSITSGPGINNYYTLSVENKSGPVVINGNISAGSGLWSSAVHLTGSCPVTITGNITGGSSIQSIALYANDSHSGPVIITGNITAGSGSNSYGFRARGSGSTITVVGNVTGGSGYDARGLFADAGNSSIAVTGNVSGGSGNFTVGLSVVTARTLTVNGDVTGGSVQYAYGLRSEHSANIATVNGTITGGTHQYAYGAQITGGTLTVNGNVNPGTAGAGMETYGSGTIINGTVTGCAYGPGNTGVPQIWTIINQYGSTLKVKNAVCGQYGHPPINGPYWLIDDATNCQFEGRQSNGTQVTLTNPAASGDYPTAANVRSGVSYAAGNLTGTCAVPAAGSVALGVPTDNTTGTAVLTAANVVTAMAAGTVAGVSGDVTGKVLGGGAGTISGTGARVVDGDGSAIATAASIAALFTTAMTEAYPTDGSTVTPAQALYLILAHLNERTVSGTTITLKKLDGSTTAATFTINDANTPTSITRAS